MVKVNDEPTYPHFFHQVVVADIQLLEISGQADISYVGFGPKDLTPAPPVGFNLTFICPEGQVRHLGKSSGNFPRIVSRKGVVQSRIVVRPYFRPFLGSR